jgi:hypothetical protein
VDLVGFSGAAWTAKTDIRDFTRIVSEVVYGTSGEHGCGCPRIPLFVMEMIEKGESADLKGIESFRDILNILKHHNFKIMEDVNVGEVSDFAKWVEWSETLIE